MNILEEFHKQPARVFDRLVDGELPPAERRELLAALDDEPGGWRSCALAFLEAQSFRWQFTRMAAEQSLTAASATSSREDSNVRVGGSPGGRNWWSMCLAVAASVVLAFGLGTRFSTSGSSTTEAPGTPIATQQPVASEAQVASAPESAADDPEMLDPLDDELLSVTLALTDGDEADSIELPVAAAGDDPQEWLDDLDNELPSGLLDRLREAGVEVVRRQRLYPVELSDGRRLIVPVEQVDIRGASATESL